VYLKRLELQGFKTFADRTELDFTLGVTAIVGPNGSGKSNVFDAIRWALGEIGYKSLRSGKMDDVIFGGSDSRRAMGMGEVSLTINNDSGALPVDYAEVTVTRRAHRGGEGEYLLNMAPCRLRDIQMLFLGTGLGGRSYSLIGQGQVDQVVVGLHLGVGGEVAIAVDDRAPEPELPEAPLPLRARLRGEYPVEDGDELLAVLHAQILSGEARVVLQILDAHRHTELVPIPVADEDARGKPQPVPALVDVHQGVGDVGPVEGGVLSAHIGVEADRV